MAKESPVVKSLCATLTKIIKVEDASKVDDEYKKGAMTDILKLLYMLYNQITQNKYAALSNFTQYQQNWFSAVNLMNKQLPRSQRCIELSNSLWRDFIITLFDANGQLDVLTSKICATWNKQTLMRDRPNHIEKMLLLSVVHQQEEQRERQESERKAKEEAEKQAAENHQESEENKD